MKKLPHYRLSFPMSKHQKVIDTYERLEEEHGGLANTLPSQIIDRTASELGLDRDYVKSVMIAYWTMAGSG